MCTLLFGAIGISDAARTKPDRVRRYRYRALGGAILEELALPTFPALLGLAWDCSLHSRAWNRLSVLVSYTVAWRYTMETAISKCHAMGE